MTLTIHFLGTGTSQGVPVIACNCTVCTSHNPKDKRLRSSILIEQHNQSIVVDSGPDFREQMLRANVQRLDAILFTHEHRDHTAGLDDVRAYNFKQQAAAEIYASPRVQQALKESFSYIFAATKYPGIPDVNLHNISHNLPFSVGMVSILPIEVMHHKLPVLGFRIGDFTYITDANFISEESMLLLKGTKTLVLNALRKEKHISHFTLSEALEIIKKIQPEKAYLTHISHLLGDHESISKELPDNVFLAYDGMKLEC